jgi:hypothetical protein
MPNGGYPMHLLTPLGDSGVEILTSGWHLHVRRRLDEGFYEFGGLNEIQTAALLYHLLYWMGFQNEELLKSIRQSLARTGFTLNPHFNKHGCFYDY